MTTRHGELQKWRVTKTGTYLQDEKESDVRLQDLKLSCASRINVILHVPSDPNNHSGINLFGAEFDDYNRAIQLVIGYQSQA